MMLDNIAEKEREEKMRNREIRILLRRSIFFACSLPFSPDKLKRICLVCETWLHAFPRNRRKNTLN